jgi:hypothetical protein
VGGLFFAPDLRREYEWLKSRKRKVFEWQIVCGNFICHQLFARLTFFFGCGKFRVAIHFATAILPELLFFANVAIFFGQFRLPHRFCHNDGFLFLVFSKTIRIMWSDAFDRPQHILIQIKP